MSEIENIILAFPNTLKENVRKVIQYLPLDHNITHTRDNKSHIVKNLIYPGSTQVVLNGELLTIPIRVYYNEYDSTALTQLSDVEKDILRCIYLTHHDGYIRQKNLEALAQSTYDFIIPFAFKLLGEYVIEILQVLDEHINPNNIHKYTQLILENPKYWQQTQARIRSYWYEYYRKNFLYLKTISGRK